MVTYIKQVTRQIITLVILRASSSSSINILGLSIDRMLKSSAKVIKNHPQATLKLVDLSGLVRLEELLHHKPELAGHFKSRQKRSKTYSNQI